VLKAGIGSELAALSTGALLLIALAAPGIGRLFSNRRTQRHSGLAPNPALQKS
jgi:hypothetical protein